MRVNRIWRIALVLMYCTSGCIEPFNPELKESQRSLVVEGLVTDMEGLKYVYVSYSSPYNDPGKIPVSCQSVEIIDDKNNYYPLNEWTPGTYAIWMPSESLVAGRGYKIRIITSGGKRYESGFVSMPGPSPPVDSIHYDEEPHETEIIGYTIDGVRFSIDLDAPDDAPRNYRWELEETWKYESEYIAPYIYYGGSIENNPDMWNLHFCWKTEKIPRIFTGTTKNISGNRLRKFPLNYVSNQSYRLRYRYSLLVRQYALSDESYLYWHRVETQTQETGGLYETQPAQLKGNVFRVNDPDEQVLGYFDVCSVSEKRIFVDTAFHYRFPRQACPYDTISTREQLQNHTEYPVYLISLSEMGMGYPYVTAANICFDCTLGGGTNIKPDFWE